MELHEKYNKAVAEYLRRLRFNNLSPKTLANYEGVLNRFGAYLGEHTIEDGADLYAVVESWRDEMMNGGAAVSSVKQYLTTLKIFFEKTTRRSFPADLRFSENPVDSDFIPTVKKKPYNNLLDDDDIIKLWRNEPPKYARAELWPRNYALVCLILGTGLRNAEVLSLRLSDVDFYNAEITVQSGKGGKYRVLDAPQIVLESLTAYLNSGLRPSTLSDNDYLFGTEAAHEYGTGAAGKTEKWHRGTKEWLSSLIERHIDNVCGGEHHIRSHDLRHLYARIHLNVNGNISELQASLGHSSPEISQIYAGRLQSRRRRDSAKAVIAARDKAAEQLRKQNSAEQEVIKLYA